MNSFKGKRSRGGGGDNPGSNCTTYILDNVFLKKPFGYLGNLDGIMRICSNNISTWTDFWHMLDSNAIMGKERKKKKERKRKPYVHLVCFLIFSKND